MTFYAENKEAALHRLETDGKQGLTGEQAAARLEKHGENRLREKEKKTLFQRFLAQFKDATILILLGAAVVSFAVAWAEGEAREFLEPALILVIVVLNAVMGVFQESRAEKALEALQEMSAPQARVIRDGQEQKIDAALLVPGDLIRLEAGDMIPADGRLLRSAGLKSEESALTGESVPTDKDAEAIAPPEAGPGDRTNMIFSGCTVTYGTGTAVVTATGMDTEMGKIAGLLEQEEETQTPLQQKLAELGKYLGIVALAACAVVFVVGLLNGIPAMEIFMTAVSLAVSAIPEGLPAIVTIVLSIGVQRMVKKNAIIRRLPAVETLGGASVICSDKTGTLTQNRMTLVQAWCGGMGEAAELEAMPRQELRKLLQYGALCCDGTVVFEEGKEPRHFGDPTETAIVFAAHEAGLTREGLERMCPRLGEIPFDSDRKCMTTVNRVDGKYIAIVKGAPDIILQKCVAGELEEARFANESMSSQALRVLAVAWRELESLPEELTAEVLEKELTLLGLVGMIDPPRPEAKAAVALCRRAGIKPVMITGDHVITASAIARELGILSEGDRALTGAELDAMTGEDLDAAVEEVAVYARVSPENKIRIVKAWQQKGNVVSMTGDGVNDAPALKAADIGCAMGITGTDVSKGVADMILTDDNFATIVDAVEEGRGIYANIRKVVGYLLGTNIGEVVAVFVAMLLWHKSPLVSLQLLWINLITDSLPAIALGMEPVEKDIMEHAPKPREEGLFAGGYGLRIILQGLMFGSLALVGFVIGIRATGLTEGGRTLAFMALAFSQTIQAFNMRSEKSLFKIGPFTNRTLNWAALVSLLLAGLVMFTPLAPAFGMMYLSPGLYGVGVLLALVPLAVMETAKALGLIQSRKFPGD